MAKKLEPTKPVLWDIDRATSINGLVGTEAVDEADAIEKATVKYGVPATDLTAVRR